MRVLRELAVIQKVGISRATLWRWERDGQFPRRIKLGPNCIGWLEAEVDDFISARLAARQGATDNCSGSAA